MARILIVEPHDDIRQLLEYIVTRLGHEVLYRDSLGNGAKASDLLLIEPADPTAIETARRLRAQDPELPIVCASIYSPTLETAALAPAAYLIKPFTLSELEEALATALARSN